MQNFSSTRHVQLQADEMPNRRLQCSINRMKTVPYRTVVVPYDKTSQNFEPPTSTISIQVMWRISLRLYLIGQILQLYFMQNQTFYPHFPNFRGNLLPYHVVAILLSLHSPAPPHPTKKLYFAVLGWFLHYILSTPPSTDLKFNAVFFPRTLLTRWLIIWSIADGRSRPSLLLKSNLQNQHILDLQIKSLQVQMICSAFV